MANMGEIQARHDVMNCPVCKETITAAVTVRPKLGTATISTDGKSVDLPVEAEMVRFDVKHHCRGRVHAVANEGAEEG